MSEKFDSQPSEEDAEDVGKKEVIEKIRHLHEVFDTAELKFKEVGREGAKIHLPVIYDILIDLNKLNPRGVVNPLAHWNPEGDLTEAEFEGLNRRRKILSNAVGILTSSGQVRHDLNPDVPESLE